MEWLNYHHLLYFWTVVREGGLAKAAVRLRLAHPTVSGQVHALEDALGEKLFAKQGRRLVLTEMGTLVYGYADEIFSLGRELLDTVKGRPTGRRLRLTVGITEVVPKLVARQLLEPVRKNPQKVQLVCREDKPERLWAELAAHHLDVVISDSPIPAGSAVRAFNHLLGETTVSLFGSKDLAARYRKGFPRSLTGAPMLLPAAGTVLRRGLDQWFDDQGLRPDVVAEFDDSALMKAFGQDGLGLFPSATAIAGSIRKQYDVEVLGEVPGVKEHFYAISVERRVRHPAVNAIVAIARDRIFKGAG